MSATWSASACRRSSSPMPHGYFKDEGLNVQLKFMPNPGDAITTLVSNAMDIIHNPFTNAFVAAGAGCADPHHRRQRRRRPVRHRAEGVRHQDHGRSRRRQGQGPEGRHDALQHLRAHALPRAAAEQPRPTATTTSCGSTTRCRWPRPSRPRRSMSSPMSSRSRPASSTQLGGVAARQQSRCLGPARPGLRDQHLGRASWRASRRRSGATSRRSCAPTPPSRRTWRRRSRCSTPASTIASTRRR